MGYRRRRRDDEDEDEGILEGVLDLALKWPPAGLIFAALFAGLALASRFIPHHEITGDFLPKMLAMILWIFAGASVLFAILGFTLHFGRWLTERLSTAAARRNAQNAPPYQAPPTQSARPSAPAPAAAATAPQCPSCGVSMVRRVARQGQHAGSAFWGCRNFPNCRQMQPI